MLKFGEKSAQNHWNEHSLRADKKRRNSFLPDSVNLGRKKDFERDFK